MTHRRALSVASWAVLAAWFAAVPAAADCQTEQVRHRERAIAAVSAAPPEGDVLARIRKGMTSWDVRRLLGNPDNILIYPTGKGWIPFYAGRDGFRTEWLYEGVGRVVFAHQRRPQRGKVFRIDWNPKEPAKLLLPLECDASLTADAPGGAFTTLRPGMHDMKVRRLLGPPDHAETVRSPKGYIPAYQGSDALRTTWTYEGRGRITFFHAHGQHWMNVLSVAGPPR